METVSGGFIQDQNLNSHHRGNSVKQSSYISTKKTIVSVGSRRALADLSNSEKPSTCLASKNLSRKLNSVDGEHNACKPTSPSGANTSVLVEFSNSGKPSTLLASTKNHSSKWSTENGEIKVPKPVSSVPGGINVPKPTSSQAPEKHQFNGRGKVNGWKALTNILNTENLCLHQASKTNHTRKLTSAADEQFLHNHKGCVKSRTTAAGMECFTRTLGLDVDSAMPSSSKNMLLEQRQGKVQSPLRSWETVEIVELPEVKTPFQCSTSELLDMDLSSQQSRAFKSPNFALMNTPAFSSLLKPLNFE